MEADEQVAYTRWDIVDYGDGIVEVFFETNDDGDTGYPGKFAQDTFIYRGENALENAKNHCGVSRQGVGQKVIVTLDGKKI